MCMQGLFQGGARGGGAFAPPPPLRIGLPPLEILFVVHCKIIEKCNNTTITITSLYSDIYIVA